MIQLVYYPGSSLEKSKKVEQVLKQFPYTYRILEEKELSQKLGYLMELEGFAYEDITPVHSCIEDLLIMNALEDDVVLGISKALRTQDCHIERKAMLTAHNKDWTLSSLLTEINNEHAYFQSYETLKRCIVDVASLEKEDFTLDSWNSYQQAFLQGYSLLQESETSQELLDIAIQKIQDTKACLQSKK